MRVTYRVRADDGFTDVCECSEFKGITSGLGIAWVCGRLTNFNVTACTVDIPDSKSGKVHTLQGSLRGSSPYRFIGVWKNKLPSTVTVTGNYESTPVSITVVFSKKVLQIYYPRHMEGKMLPLITALSKAIEEHFTLLAHKRRIDMGSKIVDEYASPIFVDQRTGLLISATSGTNKDCLIRWYAHYPKGVSHKDPLYGLQTERRLMEACEFVKQYENCPELAQSTMALCIKNKPVFVVCDHEDKLIRIFWDKWLAQEIGSFVKWFNTELYENVFGEFYLEGNKLRTEERKLI